MTRKLLDITEVGDVVIVTFEMKKLLDEQYIQRMGEQLFDLVRKSGKKKILLDWSNLEYLSSAALGKFITLNKLVGQEDGRLVLSNIDPAIYEVFDTTGLNRLFKIERDQKTALQTFQP